MRPFALNSGMGIGTLGAMRRLYAVLSERLEQDSNVGSDQLIVGLSMRDQNTWREVLYRDTHNGTSTAGRSDWRPAHLDKVRKAAKKQPDGRFEYGIGLDYESLIIVNTAHSPRDAAWVPVDDTVAVFAAEAEHGIRPKYNVLERPFNQAEPASVVPADIVNTSLPYSALRGSSSKQLPRNLKLETTWGEVPLFTNLWTGTSPIIAHLNALIDGRKRLREAYWPRMWFHQTLRPMLDVVLTAVDTPLAISGPDEASESEIFASDSVVGGWARDGIDLGTGRTNTQPMIGYDEMCGDYHEEIFRDGLGPYRQPGAGWLRVR